MLMVYGACDVHADIFQQSFWLYNHFLVLSLGNLTISQQSDKMISNDNAVRLLLHKLTLFAH